MADSAPTPSVADSAPPNSDMMALMNAITSAPAKSAKGYPPYAPYSMTPAPPSVADTITAGHDIRVRHKSMPRRPAKAAPRTARPRGPKATDVKMSKRAMRAHALCLKRHGAILTDRLEKMSKPQRRTVIYLWREHADTLPAYTIARLRNMLDADEPFKPDQAYEYFINLRKTKKKIDKARGVNQIKKDLLAVCADKRFAWARNATVSFARGIQQRLAKPGNYALSDSMLRLSNIVLSELCCYMNSRPPSRRCTHPKAKFLMEMADKIAVWIDDILTESDDRMLMMDFDEDEEVLGADDEGLAGFTEDFLKMMGGDGAGGPGGASAGGSGGLRGRGKKGYGKPAHTKFKGEMADSFKILTDAMEKKGNEKLIQHEKFSQTYAEGAQELKQAEDLKTHELHLKLADELRGKLNKTVQGVTPNNLAPYMKEMVNICSNYLAEHAHNSRHKGPAFKILTEQMKSKPGDPLYSYQGKAKQNMGQGAVALEKAKGLTSDHDDPNLSQDIHSKLSQKVADNTPDEHKKDMAETVDLASKYLSQDAVDQAERGPAFDFLIEELEKDGAHDFLPDNKYLSDNFATAHALKTAPGLKSTQPEPTMAKKIKAALERVVDKQTPSNLKKDMESVIDRCSNYLSEYAQKRDKVLKTLIKTMKAKPNDILSSRNNYKLSYGIAATELETTPHLAPSFKPIKDISDEINAKLTNDVKDKTEPGMEQAMKALIKDASDHLSQDVALKSGVAGEKYAMDLLTAVKESIGPRQLYKHKNYGQTYEGAAEELNKAHGILEKSDGKSAELKDAIKTELDKGVPTKISPHVQQGLEGAMHDAAHHLAKVGQEKGDALEHIVEGMKKKGDEPLANLQGQQQSHAKGAGRLEAAHHLTADDEEVDKKGYDAVKQKLNVIAKDAPPETSKVMPDVVDEASKYLATKDPDWNKALEGYSGAQGGAQGAGYGVGGVGTGGTGEADAGGATKGAGADAGGTGSGKAGAGAGGETGGAGAKRSDATRASGTGTGADAAGPSGATTGDASGAGAKGAGAGRASGAGTGADAAGTSGTAAGTSGAGAKGVAAGGASAGTDGIAAGKTDAAKTGAKAEGASSADGKDSATGRPGAGSAGAAAGTTAADAGGTGAKGTEASGARADEVKGKKAGETGTESAGAAGGAGAGGADGSSSAGAAGAAGRAGTSTKSEGGAGGAKGSSSAQKEEVGVGSGARGKLGSGEKAEQLRLSLGEEGTSGGRARRRTGAGGGADAPDNVDDPDRAQAQAILHQQLKARGGEILYKQPKTELTHAQASDWIKDPSKVDKVTKEAAETARLANKFERKLSSVVAKHTPANLREQMQDVIIEDSQKLSERFVSKNYNALARENLISEMQRKKNEILVEVDGAAETHFFAAQRLKKTQDLTANEPCNKVSYQIAKSLDGIIRSRAMPRKLCGTMKEHIQATSHYLSEHVTKPDEQIEAYVALLNEMEVAGDQPLIEGEIQKSYKESAAYLSQLTSYEDQINRPNAALQSSVENNLTTLMSNVPASGYSPAVMSKVIKDSTRLLVSYITLQGERTEALKVLTGEMAKEEDNMLLRHGPVRKSYQDGADLLRGKNTDQLGVDDVEPVVARKIQIKLKNLMSDRTPDKYKSIMDDVIEDATSYLAVNLLRPQLVKVCKCMKNVFVQCELWCEEILRRVARPCCTCSRHVSAQALADLAPSERITVTAGGSRAYAPGITINVTPCPSKTNNYRDPLPRSPCQARKPTPGCQEITSYLLYSQRYKRFSHDTRSNFQSSPPVRIGDDPSARLSPSMSPDLSPTYLGTPSTFSDNVSTPGRSDENRSFLRAFQTGAPNANESNTSFYTPPTTTRQTSPDRADDMPTRQISAPVYIANLENWHLEHSQTQQHLSDDFFTDEMFDAQQPTSTTKAWKGFCDTSMSALRTPSYNTRAPIITTDEMSDWHAMMVSLMWNVQAWREWIQENIDKALTYKPSPLTTDESKWMTFERRVTTEAIQWRQYNRFSKCLAMRLAVRYSNKQIMCPSRTEIITNTYIECQRETMKIIEMFNRWTHWLMAVVKETDSLRPTTTSQQGRLLNDLYWSHFKLKIQEHAGDWERYNMHLKICWEHKYQTVILQWLPPEQRLGPVWVVSACGAVPSGAVAAGVYEGEVAWVARTTHKSSVFPAALLPSKHCCIVYANGGVHQYTKYQVMCNASVSWVAWRAGDVGARAARVAAGAYVGRVLYRGSHLLGAVRAPHFRCHVVIFGRQFAFSCYELLVLADNTE